MSWRKIKNKNAEGENPEGQLGLLETVDKRLTNIGDRELGIRSFMCKMIIFT